MEELDKRRITDNGEALNSFDESPINPEFNQDK